jgi:phosphoserine phosphatase SerB
MVSKLNKKYKLVIFDMDGTLLNGRSIFVFAEEFGFLDELHAIFKSSLQPYQKSLQIAPLLKGVTATDLIALLRKIPFHDHVSEVIAALKKKKITTAVATDSYQFIAEDVQQRLGLDYAYANNLIFEKGIVTGKVIVSNRRLLKECGEGLIYSISKSTVMQSLCKQLSLSLEDVIAVGDGKVDRCMLYKAGLGIAFNASADVQQYAALCTDDLRVILQYI